MSANREDLGVSELIVSGESGGGNLSLTVTHKANREGWLHEIAGVYAQCRGYVKRTARTPHYNGVPANRRDPAVIAVFGLGPVDMQLVDPTQPSWRQV